MAVSHGMDVGEVRRLGGSLQTSAGSIDNLIKRIENAVSGSTWVGPDATVFKGTWWPEHRAHLKGMSETLHGLGQSALNNASEQERVSSVAGGSAPSNAGGDARSDTVDSSDSGGAAHEPSANSGDGTVERGSVGATSGELSGSHRDWREVQKVYERDSRAMGLGDNAYGSTNEYQCVAWAKYRWEELAKQQGIDIPPITSGNGHELAGNNGGTVDTPPSLGAMASAGDGVKFGHVMIVEEIREAPSGIQEIRVSEMNTGGNGWAVADPDEYRSTRWIAQQPDGTWVSEGTQITFAEFPGS